MAGVISGSLATSITDPQALLAGASGSVGDGKDIFAHHAIDPSWLASLLIVMEPPQKVSFDPGGVYAILLAHLPTLILNW